MGKHKKETKRHRKHYSSSSVDKIKKKSKTRDHSGSSGSDEWVERVKIKEPIQQKLNENTRDDWFSLASDFKLTSNDDKQKLREEKKRVDREKDTYDPSTNVRELNPYWKSGDGGLPNFQKPKDEIEKQRDYKRRYQPRESKWRKTSNADESKLNYNEVKPSTSKEIVQKDDFIETEEVVTEKDLNMIAAKVMKAEIMGNVKLASELKAKLDVARRNVDKQMPAKEELVILTKTDSKGYTQPITSNFDRNKQSKNKKQRIETHHDNQRIRYYPDDDKHSLKQMFSSEKFNSTNEQTRQFHKIASKSHKRDDLDDIFTDTIRTQSPIDKTDINKAIHDHKQLDNCNKCLESASMLTHLIISTGENIYVSLPQNEPLTDGQCCITPIKHASCATQLDENEWCEVMAYRRALTEMYAVDGCGVVFVETAMGLYRHPHMTIECIPMPKSIGDLAPIYFKKALDESEKEWSCNKKVISLRGRNVRRAIPKGLAYFSVSFGIDDEGFAHVIEDEKDFPRNFAQEIIGGMLDVHHSKWRKPQRQQFSEQSERVLRFSKQWKDFEPKI